MKVMQADGVSLLLPGPDGQLYVPMRLASTLRSNRWYASRWARGLPARSRRTESLPS